MAAPEGHRHDESTSMPLPANGRSGRSALGISDCALGRTETGCSRFLLAHVCALLGRPVALAAGGVINLGLQVDPYDGVSRASSTSPRLRWRAGLWRAPQAPSAMAPPGSRRGIRPRTPALVLPPAWMAALPAVHSSLHCLVGLLLRERRLRQGQQADQNRTHGRGNKHRFITHLSHQSSTDRRRPLRPSASRENDCRVWIAVTRTAGITGSSIMFALCS